MEKETLKAVPLCLPDNWSVKGQTVTGDASKCRASMKLCSEGIKVLEEIGDDKIAVICIIGPARSGKSYLLSKLVDGVSFEVGQGVISKTTGIWIGCSQGKKEIGKNQKARILLLDAEGAGAVSTEDDGGNVDWDTRLYSLCCLLSSVMIYNSNKVPESVDLERLQFVANFSSSLFSPDNRDPCLEKNKPKLVWILRNVMNDPKPFKNWEEYLHNKVLLRRTGNRSPSDESFNNIVDAIKTLFGSITVKSLPPPSTKPFVCDNLDKPEHVNDIKDFLGAIEDVKKTILETACIKRAGTIPMSGKKLLSVLEVYVKELNKGFGFMNIKTCWDANITLYLETTIQSSFQELERKLAEIEMPQTKQKIKDIHTKVIKEIEKEFLEKALVKDTKMFSGFREKLQNKFAETLKSLISNNVAASEHFCRKKVDELAKLHLENICQNVSCSSIIEQFQLYDKMIEEIRKKYNDNTKGLPKAENVFQEAETQIREQIQSTKELIITIKICEIYRSEMAVATLPVEIDELTNRHREAKSKAYKSCSEEEKYLGQTLSYKALRENKTSELFKGLQEKNKELSRILCEKAKNEILNDETLQRMIKEPYVSDYLFVPKKDSFVQKYRKKAVGPLKSEIEENLMSELDKLLKDASAARLRAAQAAVEFAYNVTKKGIKTTVRTVGVVGKWTVIAGGVTAAVGVAGAAVVTASNSVAIPAAVATVAGLLGKALTR